MATLIIDVKTERLSGGIHIFSPQVPAFHVTDQPTRAEAFKTGIPILKETISRRAQEAGFSVTLRPVTNAEVTLAKLRQLGGKRPPARPRQFVAEFAPAGAA